MAPRERPGGGKDAPLLCGIAPDGQLEELGEDLGSRSPHGASPPAAARPGGSRATSGADTRAPLVGGTAAAGTFALMGWCPAPRVLEQTVGLLGLDLHEAPASWAEVWLSFANKAGVDMGLGGEGGGEEGGGPSVGLLDRQARAIDRLRAAAAQGGLARAPLVGRRSAVGPALEEATLAEHVDLAEFVLNRISKAVGTLSSPEIANRPMVLREYTAKMVGDVCGDLKQWLPQMDTMLSAYHVYLLDSLNQQRQLREELEAEKSKNADLALQTKDATQRWHALHELWQEDKMKRRAAQLLGVSVSGDMDALIYSQNDVDAMRLEWERTHLHPLQEELQDLRQRLSDAGRGRRPADDVQARKAKPPPDAPAPEQGLPKAAVAVLVKALEAVAGRLVEEPLSDALQAIASAAEEGGAALPEILKEISRLPYPTSASKPATPAPAVDAGPNKVVGKDHPAIQLLDSMEKELGGLVLRLDGCPKATGLSALSPLIAWYQGAVRFAGAAIVAAGAPDAGPLPRPPGAMPEVDLSAIGRASPSAPARAAAPAAPKAQPVAGGGYSAADLEKLRAEVEAEWQAKLDQLRAQLEADMRRERERAEAARRELEEAIRQLEAALKAAEQRAKDLRKRLLEFEKAMKQKGMGSIVQAAMEDCGLAAFLHCPKVFERLYQDALMRMRRLAEAQLRRYEEQNASRATLAGLMQHFASPERPLFVVSGLRPSDGVGDIAHMDKGGGWAQGALAAQNAAGLFGAALGGGGIADDGSPPIPGVSPQGALRAAGPASGQDAGIRRSAATSPRRRTPSPEPPRGARDPAPPSLFVGVPPSEARQRCPKPRAAPPAPWAPLAQPAGRPCGSLSKGFAELSSAPPLSIERWGGGRAAADVAEPHPEPRPEAPLSPFAAGKPGGGAACEFRGGAGGAASRGTCNLPRLAVRQAGAASAPSLGLSPSPSPWASLGLAPRLLMQGAGLSR